MTTDLFNEFSASLVEQSELEMLLMAHFGRCNSVTNEEIQYTRQDGQPPAVILRYGKDGVLLEILPGPECQSEDVESISEKVRQQLLYPGKSLVGQVVLFAHLPTTGGVRYHDDFQLLPVPADAPRHPQAILDHPLLLQFHVPGSVESQITMFRKSRIERELELVLTAITTTITGAIGNTWRSHWCYTGDTLDTSGYFQEGYTWPGANVLLEDYSSLDGVAPIERLLAAKYYSDLAINVGESIKLPDKFERLFECFYSLSITQHDRFMRAAYWLKFARNIGNVSKSGAFTALVSAVEALLPESSPERICSECSRPIGIGPTRLFIDFVECYAPTPDVAEKNRRYLYSLRSALSHGGRLLHFDRPGWGGGLTQRFLSDMQSQENLWRVVQVVLVNWLVSPNSK